MTLWGYALLIYLVIAGVFASLIASSREWQEASSEDTSWQANIVRSLVLMAFGMMWPLCLVIWVVDT